MKRSLRITLASILAAGGLVAGALVATARSSPAIETGELEDGQPEAAEDAFESLDVPITGPDLDRASRAALAFLGEGRVTATEVGDEESYYEVEVTLEDGRQVDVQLDEAFNVVGTD